MSQSSTSPIWRPVDKTMLDVLALAAGVSLNEPSGSGSSTVSAFSPRIGPLVSPISTKAATRDSEHTAAQQLPQFPLQLPVYGSVKTCAPLAMDQVDAGLLGSAVGSTSFMPVQEEKAPYFCRKCGSSFGRRASYNRHTKRSSNPCPGDLVMLNPNGFPCHKCHKSFANDDSRRVHLRDQHNINKPTCTPKRHMRKGAPSPVYFAAPVAFPMLNLLPHPSLMRQHSS